MGRSPFNDADVPWQSGKTGETGGGASHFVHLFINLFINFIHVFLK